MLARLAVVSYLVRKVQAQLDLDGVLASQDKVANHGGSYEPCRGQHQHRLFAEEEPAELQWGEP